MATRNDNRQYSILKIVVCNGGPTCSYINHMVVRGPQGGLMLLDKTDSEKIIKRVFGQNQNAMTLVQNSQRLANMLKCAWGAVGYVKPGQVNYKMLCQQYQARKATDDAVKFAGDYLQSLVSTLGLM